ncbi:hypothetical protein LCGC14_1846690 [marine sediment metagenome]|uniref:DUF642 domain-containing protein n=1 Tax=marine sediment metagenome TaxID=412755 RepID=A0A0F9JAU5_9ZZZZ
MSGRSAGMALLGIIAFGGLGLSGYMFLKYEFLSPMTPTQDSGLILVGLWDDLSRNTDYTPWDSTGTWLLEFRNSPLNDSNYISVSNGNTHFVLIKEGYYKITLTLRLDSLDANAQYAVDLLKNGSVVSIFAQFAISANPSQDYYPIQSSLYVYGNGVDYFAIVCNNAGDPSFTISEFNIYNQLSIEYVL